MPSRKTDFTGEPPVHIIKTKTENVKFSEEKRVFEPHSLDFEVLLEDPVAEEDDLDAARGGHGVGAEVGDGERAELLAVADDARDHGLQHLRGPPLRLRQEHLQGRAHLVVLFALILILSLSLSLI